MPSEWIEARGQPIFFIDYRGLQADQTLELLEEVRQVIASVPTKPMLLVDYTDAPVSMEYLNRIQRIGRELLNEGTRKIAVLGITGLKAMFLEAYLSYTGTKNTRSFASRAEALDWLCGPVGEAQA